MGAFRGPGFLGTGATLLADITLLVQILFFLVLCLGVAAQLKRAYHWHDKLQTPVVVLNLLFIGLVMLPSFISAAGDWPAGLRRPPGWVPAVHGTLGALAEGVAIYCLLAGFKILPRKIGVLRYWMWTAFTLWTAAVLFGVGTYLVWYTGGSSEASTLVAEHDADLLTGEIEAAPALPTDEPVSEHAEEAVDQATEPAPETPAEPVSEHDEAPLVEPAPETPSELVSEHDEAPLVEPAPEPPAELVSEHDEALAAEPEPGELDAPAAPTLLGWLYITDADIHSDNVTLQLSGITPPPPGFNYEGWLQTDGQQPFSIGLLTVSNTTIDHTFVDPAGRNLLGLYDQMMVTVEPAGDTDPAPSADVAFAGQVPSGVLEPVRQLVVTADTPDRDGLVLNAIAEAGLTLLQIEAQQRYVSENNLIDLQIHAETPLNLLEGSSSPTHGDRDGDGEVYNPGDGYGLLATGQNGGYLNGILQQATLAGGAQSAPAEVALYAGAIETTVENVVTWAEQLHEVELQILQVSSAAAAAELVSEAFRLGNALLDGVDANGDGRVDPLPGEGGLRTLYLQAQLMAGMPVFAAGGSVSGQSGAEGGQTTPEPGLTPTLAPAATPTAAPTPTATPTVELISEHDE